MRQKHSLKTGGEEAQDRSESLGVDSSDKQDKTLGNGKASAITLPAEMNKVFEAMKRTFERDRESGH